MRPPPTRSAVAASPFTWSLQTRGASWCRRSTEHWWRQRFEGKAMGEDVREAVLVLHGPNLNLLGEREPRIYGSRSLQEIDWAIEQRGRELGIEVRCVQSNVEGEMVNAIQ